MRNIINRSSCIIYFYLLYFFLSIFWGYIYYTNESSEIIRISSFIVFILFLLLYFKIECLLNKNLYSYWFRPSYVLLFSLIIVNLQTIINVILGYGKIHNYLGTMDYDHIFDKVYYISLLAIISFMVGNISFKYRNVKQGKFNYNNYVYNIWILITVFSLIMFVINIDIISFITGLNYKGSGAYDRVESESAKWETLFDTFLTICVSLMTLKNKNKLKNCSLLDYIKAIPKPLFIVSLIYILLRLLSGDRGMALYTILLYFYSYLYLSNVRFKLKWIFLMVLVGAFTMSLLNYVRGYGSDQSLLEKINRGFNDMSSNSSINDKSIFPLTQELANSVNCNFIAISDVENKITEFKHGKYNFSEMLGGVPGAASISKRLFNIDLYENSTTEYITKSFFGKYYPKGLGTTSIAAIYLDFGTFGVIIIFILLGLIMKYIDYLLIYRSIFSVALFVFFIKISSMTIYIPRSSFSWILSRIIYILIFYFVLHIAFSILRFITSRKRSVKADLIP